MNRRHFVKSAALGVAAPIFIDGSFQHATASLKVAVIGHTGRGNYGHGMDTLWLNVPECRIVAVADPDESGLENAQKRLKGAKGYNNFQDMLDTERPDIVSIAPRHIDQHRDMILSCIQKGVKGIYVEKPFCRDLGEADEIVEACAKNGVKLALAHRNRYHPALKKAKEIVESGELGKVLEIRARGKEDHRGGVLDLWVLGSHILNLVPLFTGPFTNCSASMWSGQRSVRASDLKVGDEGVGLVGGDRLHARFMTEKDIVVYFDSIRGAGVAEGNFGFQILGTKGALDIRIDFEPLVSLLSTSSFYPQKGRPQWHPVTSGGVGVAEPIKTISEDIAGHKAPVYDLIASMRSDERRPLCNELEGRATIEAIMGIFESHKRAGAVVDFPLSVKDNPLTSLR